MPTPLTLSRAQILARRRVVNGLDARRPWTGGALGLATWAGVCDSMPRAALLSLHARLEGVGAGALDDPALIQIWGPRYSCYVIRAEDRAVFTVGRLPAEARGRDRAHRIADGLARLLAAGVSDDRRISAELEIHPNALKYATTTGRVQIRWDGARSPDMWIVPAPETEPDAARRELARRHLHMFGPSDSQRFSEWAGISGRSAAATYAALEAAGELIGVRTPSGDAWILLDDAPGFPATHPASDPDTDTDTDPARPSDTVRLLPSGDAYTLAQGIDRELLVPDALQRADLWPSRVWPGALLIAGELRGTWRRAGARLSVRTWGALTSTQRATLEAEALALPLPGLPAGDAVQLSVAAA